LGYPVQESEYQSKRKKFDRSKGWESEKEYAGGYTDGISGGGEKRRHLSKTGRPRLLFDGGISCSAGKKKKAVSGGEREAAAGMRKSQREILEILKRCLCQTFGVGKWGTLEVRGMSRKTFAGVPQPMKNCPKGLLI